MPGILDKLLGKDDEQKKQAEEAKAEEVARQRREELAKERADIEAARLRNEAAEKERLAKLEADKAAADERAKQAILQQTQQYRQQQAAAAAQPTAAAAQPAERTYEVKSGDSLSKIAKALYGDAKRWPEIYAANKALIGDNPNLIRPGQKLRIP